MGADALVLAKGVMRFQAISILLTALSCTGCDRSRSHEKVNSDSHVVVGKLLIQAPAYRKFGAKSDDHAENFWEEQIKALRGPKLRQAAESKLLKDHAHWEPSVVKLEVAHIRGSSIASLIGRGGSADCASLLINLIMDEYLSSIALNRIHGSEFKSETVITQKRLKDAELAWNSFKLNHDLAQAASNLAALQRRLKQLTAAKTFYQREMESSASLSLEQDIQRRRTYVNSPPDMPAEFAAIARVSPTASELAYLEVIRQTNAVAIDAARKEVTNDRAVRLDSHRRQVEILDELLGEIQADIAKLSALQHESQAIEQAYLSAESAYQLAKAKEMNEGMIPENSDAPPVMASVLERATVVKQAD